MKHLSFFFIFLFCTAPLAAQTPPAVHPRIQAMRDHKTRLLAANPGVPVNVPYDELRLNDDLYAVLSPRSPSPLESLPVDEVHTLLLDYGVEFVRDLLAKNKTPARGTADARKLSPDERNRLRELRGRWAFLFDSGTLYSIDALLSTFSKTKRGADGQVAAFLVGGSDKAGSIDHTLFAALQDSGKELVMPDSISNRIVVRDRPALAPAAAPDLMGGFARIYAGSGEGSGYVVYSPPAGERGRSNGKTLIVTAGHVVDTAGDPSRTKTVVIDGRQYTYTVVAKKLSSTDGSDAALLSIAASGLPSARVRSNMTLNDGMFYLGQGAEEDEPTIKLAGATYKNSGGKRIDTAVIPTGGNSGGALFDSEGCVAGVVCSSDVDAASHEDRTSIVRPRSLREPNYDRPGVGGDFSDHKQIVDLLKGAGYGWVIEQTPPQS